jgi:hypothetical protein
MNLGTFLRPLENRFSQRRDRGVTSHPFTSLLDRMATQGSKDVLYGAATVSEVLDHLAVAAGAGGVVEQAPGSFAKRETP